jgi:hypothetical protein
VPGEHAIAVNPGDVFPVERQATYSEVNSPLFQPQLVKSSQLNMLRVVRRRDGKFTITERDLDCVKNGPGFINVLLEILIELPARPKTGCVNDWANHVKRLSQPVWSRKHARQLVFNLVQALVMVATV